MDQEEEEEKEDVQWQNPSAELGFAQPTTTFLQTVLGELSLDLNGDGDSALMMNGHGWCWDRNAAEKLIHEETVRFVDGDFDVQFHPLFSYGTAAVWGKCTLTELVRAYWEIEVNEVYGSSMMFGIGTRNALQAVPYGFVDLLGGVGRLGEQAYGLSHKGVIFHACEGRPFCERFRTVGGPCTVGVLFDGPSARLGFSLDGRWLGWAFRNVKLADRVYFPMVSSTAQRSSFRLLRHKQRQLCTAQPLRAVCLDTIVMHLLTNNGTELPMLGRLGLPKGVECELWQKWCAHVMDGWKQRQAKREQKEEGQQRQQQCAAAAEEGRRRKRRKRKWQRTADGDDDSGWEQHEEEEVGPTQRRGRHTAQQPFSSPTPSAAAALDPTFPKNGKCSRLFQTNDFAQ